MNTGKQVNVMIGLLFVFLIGTLLYFVWDSVRADDAEERQTVTNAERGGALFSLNCRVCHGANGLGVQENPNLPGVPLNLEVNRGIDPETGEFNPSLLFDRQARVRDTIRCGRVGTLMPQWAEDQGGALNDFQIEQLVALITGAMPGLDLPENTNAVSELGWEAAIEEADHADILEGKRLAEAIGPADTILVLADAEGLTIDGLLRIGEDEVVRIVDAPVSGRLNDEVGPTDVDLSVDRAAELFHTGDVVQVGDERMRVVSVQDDMMRVDRGAEGTEAREHRAETRLFEPGDEITVERGAFGTEAASHEEGAQVFAGPIEPPTGPLTGEGGTPPCGQLPPAVPPPSAEPIPVESGATLEMGDNFFQLEGQQNPTLEVTLGQEITLNLVNNGAAVHNMHIAGTDNEYGVSLCETGGEEPCSDPAAMSGGDTGTITFTFEETGTFDFRCDFHPVQMVGKITVVE